MTISATTQGIKPGVCTSTNRPSAPFDGQVIYMTDVDQTAVWDGTQWTVLAPIAGGRNAIINGAMKVSQRGTSFSFATGSGAFYYGADRWRTQDYTWSAGTNPTVSNETSVVPTGFSNSYKWANGATPLTFASGGQHFIQQAVEGFNAFQLYGKVCTLSFWVRSSTAGTYTIHVANGANTRSLLKTYSISSANTWEYKTVTIDTTNARASGVWETTNGFGIQLQWMLGAHADRTGSNNLDAWGAMPSYHFLATGSVNLATIANSTFYLTGVQLEAGAVATPFEFEDYGTTLAKCQRYYFRHIDPVGVGVVNNGGIATRVLIPFHTQMRSVPTTGISGTLNFYNGSAVATCTSINASYNTANHSQIDFNATIGSTSQTATLYSTGGSQYLEFSSEL